MPQECDKKNPPVDIMNPPDNNCPKWARFQRHFDGDVAALGDEVAPASQGRGIGLHGLLGGTLIIY